ncbi:MAG: hypothetical protein RLZZ385_1559 [Pseudomonadota bacterium]|jgi:tRNA-dihydrouridine synthase B
MLRIGGHYIANQLLLAPMAGVSDKPFREICAAQGAGLTVAEMITANPERWQTDKNSRRMVKPDIPGPQVVQIVGSDPAMLADAARLNVELGADIIDINMGCPAKKVLKKAAGSALLKDIDLVDRILQAVVQAVPVPVTLKIRTGWCPASRNGVEVARLAEQRGVAMLTVHGRTRQCRFLGEAEYDTIAAIKQAVTIPVIANGDITSPAKARQVLAHTGADGIMIGRGAQGQPWLFREILHFLHHGSLPAKPAASQVFEVMLQHLRGLHDHYGEFKGLLFARKHVNWYLKQLSLDHPGTATDNTRLWQAFSACTSNGQQMELLHGHLDFITSDTRMLAA